MRRRDFFTSSAAGLALSAPAFAAQMQGELRITDLETDLLRFPPGRPEYDAVHRFGDHRGGVVLRLKTNAGHTGWAYSSFGMVQGGPEVLQTIFEKEIKPLVVGQDPAFPKLLRKKIWNILEYHGVQGIAQFAIGATDMAVWDILAKAAGLPLYKMLGAAHDRMPVYSMCGWYYEGDSDLSIYRKAIEDRLAEGFRAIKVKTGRGSFGEDMQRLRAAREIAGPTVRIMVDANQGLNRNEALRRGRAYQEEGCFWYEEPMPPHEKDGYAMLAQELDIRIATGENEYTKYEFLELLKRDAADVLQPDNRRAGGVTEWMEIAALADAFGVEIASHGGGPANLHMLLAMPNAIYMETGSLKGNSQYLEALRMQDGAVLAPEAPGMGSDMRPDWIQKYKVG
ncbi:MAG: mandelate racemase/muconate lactonizing enzyme family protein [Bryobacterales bacterium]